MDGLEGGGVVSTTERTVQHTPEPWREGIPGTVVADMPIEGGPGGVNGADAVAYYGGNLIGESMTVANARRIVACVNACSDVPTDMLKPGLVRELVEALEQAVEQVRGLADRTSCACGLGEVCFSHAAAERWEAVLAKARGEA